MSNFFGSPLCLSKKILVKTLLYYSFVHIYSKMIIAYYSINFKDLNCNYYVLSLSIISLWPNVEIIAASSDIGSRCFVISNVPNIQQTYFSKYFTLMICSIYNFLNSLNVPCNRQNAFIEHNVNTSTST